MRKNVKNPTFQYGIEITKPWSEEMYAHNDKVSELQKEQIFDLIEKFGDEADENQEAEDNLYDLGKIICGYGFGHGYGNEEIVKQISQELENAQYFWMNGDVWPDVLGKDWVEPLEIDYVGY